LFLLCHRISCCGKQKKSLLLTLQNTAAGQDMKEIASGCYKNSGDEVKKGIMDLVVSIFS